MLTRRRIAQYGAASAALVAGVTLLQSSRACLTPEAQARRLGARHGILIGYGEPSTFFVPPYSEEEAHLAWVRTEKVEAEALPVALDGIERALDQYPPGFVAKLIDAIFIAGEIEVGGASAGGTVGPAWIILAASASLGRDGIFATSYIGVHHELSSFVLHHDLATLSEWASFAPRDWQASESPTEIIARSEAEPPDLTTGFLSAYGATNPENDFNVYAEKIFTDPEAVVTAARTYPLVRRKLEFIVDSYVRIEPRMSAVFGELGVAVP